MKLRGIITAFSLAALLAACQSAPPVGDESAQAPTPREQVAGIYGPEKAPKPTKAAPLRPATDLWERIRRELTWQSIHNARVGQARDAYLRQPNYFPVVAERAQRYLHYIVEEVERRDMPMEIALLPLVESTLDPFAYSSQQAAGLWQIMPATAKHYGVNRNWWYDGRLDLRESTAFALDYLEALHAEFDNDWLLALAAYNSGKGRVGRARAANEKRGKPTDYWSLDLPRETRHYVPRLIALSAIIRYPETFAVTLPPIPNAPAFDIAETGGQIEMLRAAELAGLELADLRALNPGQLRWATSPDHAQELLLPAGIGDRFRQQVAQLTPDDRVSWQHYRIRRGDSLIRIAKQFNTEVGLLREVNNIRGNLIRAGDTMMIPEGSAWASSLALADAGKTRSQKGYRVRRGDSLYGIATRFDVSIDEIITWNALDPGKYLQPGQTLTLYVSGG
jgi:membrane-bound lytic murein transglycosylase D